MVKKIMMDMKLNSKRNTKVIEPINLPTEIHVEKTIEENSIIKPSVFTHGWPAVKEPVSVKLEVNKPHINPTIATQNKDPAKRLSSTPQLSKNRTSKRKPVITIFSILVLLALVYGAMMFFERATITITEKTQNFTLDKDQFTASKNSQTPLGFEIMIVSDTDYRNMILTESEDVSIKAKGKVAIYNEFSKNPQKLLVNSFIADESGKMYRTDTATVIPGYTTDGVNIIPGQAVVDITAFLPGDSYNSNATDFIINGFKGTPKEKKIYAKALTSITGGAEGLVYVLGDKEKSNLGENVISSFKNRLMNKVNAQVPEGYILYPNAISFSYTINSDIKSLTPDAKVGIDGTINALILKKSDVLNVVIKSVLPDISSNELKEIEIPDISNLTFNFKDANQNITKDMQSVYFTLTGAFDALWHPDIESLKLQIIGIPKEGIESIFKSDPGIVDVNVTLFPPWQSKLPSDMSKIKILVN